MPEKPAFFDKKVGKMPPNSTFGKFRQGFPKGNPVENSVESVNNFSHTAKIKLLR